MSPPRAALARTNGPLILQVMEPMGLRRIMTLVLGFQNIIEFKSVNYYILTKTNKIYLKNRGFRGLGVKVGNVQCHQHNLNEKFSGIN